MKVSHMDVGAWFVQLTVKCIPRKELLYPVLWLGYEISKLNLAWLDHLETQVGPKDVFCPITFRA